MNSSQKARHVISNEVRNLLTSFSELLFIRELVLGSGNVEK
ncbi:hypothetical protein Cabys_3430 [Caldithrix abyssi DSM 13497]|uniref:Uncharacterized protein n=1 Tax=Caldithrix abyssi DSM 13497 TaxID=880073 RepID=A0A1J1CE51_CALAY|nr:hypothetical protein Cabys_3430 [Caldithrix abyssi DSM 13497]